MDIGLLSRQSQWDLRRVDPARPAVSFADEATWSYGELDAQSNAYANALRGLGVERGDRVGLLLYNSLEYWAVYLATTKIGAVAVRLNFRLTTEELRYCLTDSGATVLCVSAALAERIEPLRETLDVGHYLCLPDGDAPAPGWALPWTTLTEGDRRAPDAARPAADDPAMLMYTSGTTGRPKGALWTHGNTAWFAAIQALQWKFDADTVGMVTGPMYHVGAIEDVSIATLAAGGHVVVMPSTGFDVARAMRLVAHHRVTDVMLFPFMVYALLDHPEVDRFDLSSLRRVISGGDPVLPHAIDGILARYPGVEFIQIYGLTEGTPIAACAAAADATSHPGSVGRPLPFCEITIRDDAGAVVEPGGVGEIWIRSPVNAVEYWRKPDATEETFVDGWCRTGDLGTRNADGLLQIAGRKKDMIRSGGENIYPAEVEDVLIRHPGIAEGAVIAVPDERYAEAVCAVVVPAAGANPTADDVVGHCRTYLAGYKKPRYVVFVDELPRTPSGKIQKFVLRERYQSLPQDQEAVP